MTISKTAISLPIMQRSKSLPANFTSHVTQPPATLNEPSTYPLQDATSSQTGLKRRHSLPSTLPPPTRSSRLQLDVARSASDLSAQSQASPDQLLNAKSPSLSSQDSVGSLGSICPDEIVVVDRKQYGIPSPPLLDDEFSDFEQDMEEILGAVEKNNKKGLEELLEKNPDACELINLPMRSYGSTPLMYASQLGSHDSVETLLKFNAKVDTQAENGHTALTLAVSEGHSEVVSTLIKQGANVRILTPDKTSVLHKAVCSGNIEVLKTLCNEAPRESRRLVDQQSKTGFTALMLAATNKNPEFVKTLLQLGPNVHINRGVDGATSNPKDVIYYANSLQNPVTRKERIALISGFSPPEIEPGFVHVGVTRLPRAAHEEGPSYLFVAMDEATGWACSRTYDKNIDESSVDFLRHLHQTANFKINKLLAHNREMLNDNFARNCDKKIIIDCLNEKYITETINKALRHPNTKYATGRFNELVGEINKQIRDGFSSAVNSQTTLNNFLSTHNIEPLKYLDNLAITQKAKSLGRNLRTLASHQFIQHNIVDKRQSHPDRLFLEPSIYYKDDDSDESESSYHKC